MFEEYVIGDNESFNLLEKKTLPSSSTTTTFSNLLGDSTLLYRLIINLKITTSGSETKLGLRFNTSATGYNSTEDYSGKYNGGGTTGNGTYLQLCRSFDNANTYIDGIYYIFPNKNVNQGGYRSGFGNYNIYVPGTSIIMTKNSGHWSNTSDQITGITIYRVGSGTISGQIRLSKMAPTWGD